MKKYIVINAVVEGLHYWENCNLPQVQYLKQPHRHQFYINCKKAVKGLDRDIEIITFKNEVVNYLKNKYFDNDHNCPNFGGMSCEMIAKELLETFGLNSCSVLEDNENGALVEL